MRISDWSSDVCSSDLPPGALSALGFADCHLFPLASCLVGLAEVDPSFFSSCFFSRCAPILGEPVLSVGLLSLEPDCSVPSEDLLSGGFSRCAPILDEFILSDRKSTRLNSSH